MMEPNEATRPEKAATRPVCHRDAESLVDEIIRRVGKKIVLGIPLGIGKPNHIVNALVQRAERDRSVHLRILTALTLGRARPRNELERRLIEPLNARLFGNYPELAYRANYERGTLPSNVEVVEFFLAPGKLLNTPNAQQSYTSVNYSEAMQQSLDAGLNVFAQLVAPGPERLSLSSNPDIALSLLPILRERRARGEALCVCGQVNRELPFMPGEAEVARDEFDLLLDDPSHDFQLPSVPSEPIDARDQAIGLYAAGLVRDGGTLQLGIGALGDAVTSALLLRHQQPKAFRGLLEGSELLEIIEREGGTQPFVRGLYGATEMFVDGFLQLHEAGILSRRVYDCAALQRWLDTQTHGADIDMPLLETLLGAGVSVAKLKALGVLSDDAPNDRAQLGREHLGRELKGGVLLHAGFFMGPAHMYERLRELPPAARAELQMVAISVVNELYGDYELKVAQRRHARFMNTGLMATVLGAVTSDGLEDGRVISGVGGQYNFVAMAHALPEARSILLIRSTRKQNEELFSNVRYTYGHTTIPRHLRDIVVTEYGIKDLRGKSDAEVIASMIELADARFQQDLVREAQGHGKLPKSYRLPERARTNTAQRVSDEIGRARSRKLLPELPFGSDLTQVELALIRALPKLKRGTPKARWRGLRAAIKPPLEKARPYLERMNLEAPRSLEEQVMQRAVLFALAAEKTI
jgi:acyl-CoA hydrolase